MCLLWPSDYSYAFSHSSSEPIVISSSSLLSLATFETYPYTFKPPLANTLSIADINPFVSKNTGYRITNSIHVSVLNYFLSCYGFFFFLKCYCLVKSYCCCHYLLTKGDGQSPNVRTVLTWVSDSLSTSRFLQRNSARAGHKLE